MSESKSNSEKKKVTEAEIARIFKKHAKDQKAEYYPPDGPPDDFFVPLFQSFSQKENSWMNGKREIFYIQTLIFLDLDYLGEIKPEAFEIIKAALSIDISRRLRDTEAEIRNSHYRDASFRIEINSNRQSLPQMKKFIASLKIPEKS